jgi:hypothetical protein
MEHPDSDFHVDLSCRNAKSPALAAPGHKNVATRDD